MTRALSGDTVVVKPSNNVYTALAAIATIAVILGIIIVNVRAAEVFGQGILW